MKKKLIIFFVLFNIWLFAQESEGGRPLFFDYMSYGIDGSVINIDESYITPANLLERLKIINKTLNNEAELKNLEAYIKEYPKVSYLNFYGKKIEINKDFKSESTKFKLEDKFICLLKIRSENAYSVQALFSKFNVPTGAKFFLYNGDGMILGSFSSKNIVVSKESENVFVTQPLKGNEIYLELDLENESDLANVDIQINTIMHGFSNLYASDGPFSPTDATTYTSCNKNVSCVDGSLLDGNNYNSTINKGNIKSVGLIVNTNALYGFTCSGTLINNTKQDGTPYFLTAEHCVRGTPQQPIFLNESVVIFNHETKSCNGDGNTIGGNISSPSTNSIGGMQVLTSIGITKYPDGTFSGLSQDFALMKLNTTAEVLKKYKVCYSGWSTVQFPNNIGFSFTAHHPSGVVKKISITNQSYITPTNFSATYDFSNIERANVYFSKSFSTNLSQGYFLATEFGNGFPYHGSSGASLFTRDGFILGTLSSGPEQEISNETPTKPINILSEKFKACGSIITNKAKYNVLFSRFWRDYIFMQPWLNPDNQNIQSIGNYCPTGIGAWGSVNIENPQEGCIEFLVKDKYYTPDNLEETVKDVNQYRVKPFSTYGKKIYVKTGFSPSVNDSGFNEPKMSNKLLCLGLDRTCQGYYYLNHSYRISQNSIKKIKAKDVFMTNQLNINGEFPPIQFSLINADDDRIAVFAKQNKLYGNSDYNKFEVNIYKYNETTNEYDTESIIDVFENALAFRQSFPYSDIVKAFFEKNTVIILIASSNKIGIVKFHRISENSPWIKDIFPSVYQAGFNQSISSNFKTFFKKDLLVIEDEANGTYIFNIKSGTSEPPILLIKKVGYNNYLGVKNINFLGGASYELFTTKHHDSNYGGDPGKLRIWKLNISSALFNNYFTISVPYNVNLPGYFRFLSKIYVNSNYIVVPEVNDSFAQVQGKKMLFFRDGNQWGMAGINYSSPPKSPTFGGELIALNDSYFLDDAEWKYLAGDSNGSSFNLNRTQLYPAYNVLNAEHLGRVFFGEYLSGAYMVLDNLERSEWLKGSQGGAKRYDNTIQPQNALNIVTSDTHDGAGVANTSGTVKIDYRNPKTYILSGYTAPLTPNTTVELAAHHSVVIKPGFGVSAYFGNEFRARATSTEKFPESLTYDDMLHPELSDYHDKADKKMTTQKNVNLSQNETGTYGEIIFLKDDIDIKGLKKIKIYPNPTDGILFIDTNGQKANFEIINIAGQKLREGELIGNKIDVSGLNKGVYLLSLKVNNKIESFKFIKK